MIEQSESIKNLAGALLKAQMELGQITENATNPFFKSKYADLGEHIKTIKPAFQKHGLVVTQFISGLQNEVGVTTMLMHESGEWLKSTAVIPMEQEKGNSKAQTAGKAISYLRRYALASVANVYSGDDEDGNVKPVQQRDQQNGNKKRPLEPQALKTMLAKKVLEYQGKEASIKFRSFIAGALGSCLKDDRERYAVTEYLTGQTSIKDISDEMVFAFRDWLGMGDGTEPSEEAEQEIQKVLRAALKEQGQTEMEM